MSDSVSLDGSPVEAYAALPAEPELGVVRGLLAGRRRVLDLGCGTGRIADPLAEDGFHVVAVDESQQMLDHVRHALAVRGSYLLVERSSRHRPVIPSLRAVALSCLRGRTLMPRSVPLRARSCRTACGRTPTP